MRGPPRCGAAVPASAPPSRSLDHHSDRRPRRPATTAAVPARRRARCNDCLGGSRAGATATTTTAPQHVVNQPNLQRTDARTSWRCAEPACTTRKRGRLVAGDRAGRARASWPHPVGRISMTAKAVVVLLHGVNVVYKHAPYIAYPTRGAVELRLPRRPQMRSRFQRRAPRHRVAGARARDPGGRTSPRSARPARRATRTSSTWRWRPVPAHVAATVKLLGPLRHLHAARHAPGRVQREFRGEGAPDWAVCTDGVPDRAKRRAMVEQLPEPGS